MDSVFNGMPGSEHYRAQVFPELYPDASRMLVENWSVEDQEMYCGVVSRPDTRRYTSSEGGKDG